MSKLKEFYDKYKEWIDQSLHITAGAGFTALFAVWVALPVAALSTAIIAVGREMRQHRHSGECHAGCRLDLIFWTVGILGYVLYV